MAWQVTGAAVVVEPQRRAHSLQLAVGIFNVVKTFLKAMKAFSNPKRLEILKELQNRVLCVYEIWMRPKGFFPQAEVEKDIGNRRFDR
jgi:hypothetical protein